MSQLSRIFKRFRSKEPSPNEILEKFKEALAAPSELSQSEEGSALPGNTLVIQISRPPTAELLTEFITQLVAHLSPSAEISVMTQSEPSSDQISATLTARTLHSYLVIRESGATDMSKTAELVTNLLRCCSIDCELLNHAQVQEFCRPWLLPDSGNGSVTKSMRGSSSRLYTHRLQRQRYLDSCALRTLESTHFHAKDPSNPGISHRMTRLIQGPEMLVRAEAEGFLHEDYRAGYRPEIASPAQLNDRLDALPWLISRKQAQAALKRGKTPRRAAHELGPLLPVPCGASPLPLAAAEPGYRMALDHLGVPVVLATDPYYASNIFIAGNAGTGKTHLANSMAEGCVLEKGHAWVLSQNGSPILCESMGGQNFRLHPESGCSLNPLHGISELWEFQELTEVLVSWLATLANIEVEPKNVGEHRGRAVLEMALLEAWQQAGENLGLTHVLHVLEASEPEGAELAVAIRSHIEGLGSTWFEGPCDVDFNVPFVNFDVPYVPSEFLQNLLPLTVMVLFTAAALRLPRKARKVLVVDDLSMLGKAGAAALLRSVLRRTRTMHAQAIVISQSYFGDAEMRWPHETTVREACGNTILFQLGHLEAASAFEEIGFGSKSNFVNEILHRRDYNMVRFAMSSGYSGVPMLLQIPRDAEASVRFSPSAATLIPYVQARKAGATPAQAYGIAMLDYRQRRK